MRDDEQPIVGIVVAIAIIVICLFILARAADQCEKRGGVFWSRAAICLKKDAVLE